MFLGERACGRELPIAIAHRIGRLKGCCVRCIAIRPTRGPISRQKRAKRDSDLSGSVLVSPLSGLDLVSSSSDDTSPAGQRHDCSSDCPPCRAVCPSPFVAS